MSDMMFDQQHDARIGFGEATVNTRSSAKPAALRHEPSSRAQLVGQWHRSAQGPLTCMWTEVPSTPPGGARDLRLPDLAREDHFTCASRINHMDDSTTQLGSPHQGSGPVRMETP